MANVPGNPQPNPADLGAVLLAINTGIDRRQRHDDEKHARDSVVREKREWLDIEARKIDNCEGLPERAMRQWLRSHVLAMGRTPQIVPANVAQQATLDKELGQKLMTRTASGPLVRELDRSVANNPNHTVTDTLEALEATFLGADEPAAKRAELEKMRQRGSRKPDDAIPAYVRRFVDMADEAYGVAGRAPEQEAKLSELFVTSLHDEKVAEEIFAHEPPLLTLAGVTDHATEIHNRTRHMERAWHGRKGHRRETPMEIGPVDQRNKNANAPMAKNVSQNWSVG